MRRSNMFQPYWTTSTRTRLHAGLDLVDLEVRDADERGPFPPRRRRRARSIVSSNGVSRSGQCTMYTSTRSVPRFLRLLSIEAMHPLAAAVAQVRLVPVVHAELGDDDRLVPARAERLAERALGRAHAVALGGVEAVDAEVERPPDGARELGLLDLPVAAADLPAAEADGRDVEPGPSERSMLHRVVLLPGRGLATSGTR